MHRAKELRGLIVSGGGTGLAKQNFPQANAEGHLLIKSVLEMQFICEFTILWPYNKVSFVKQVFSRVCAGFCVAKIVC